MDINDLPVVTAEPGTPCEYSLACSREAVLLRDMGMAVSRANGGKATPICQSCADLQDRLRGK